MKILYISPENTVGSLGLWQKIHQNRGNECRYVTFYPSAMGFEDDICLNLPGISPDRWFHQGRRAVYRQTRGPMAEDTILEGTPPIWHPHGWIERAFFAARDRLWRWWIEPAIKRHNLLDFDIYHFEWGLDFYRNGDFIRRVDALDKLMLATYHGQDFRNRGVIPAVDARVQINLTSEYDLVPRHPNMRYMFLPYDVQAVKPMERLGEPVTLCHATRNRYHKGSDIIIDTCTALEKSHNVRFQLIEDRPHAETMAMKARADIYIDQVADVAPGYGMNSIETMALGIACVTYMNPEYEAFMPGHPFVNVTAENLAAKLTELVENSALIQEFGRKARQWALDHHDLSVVGERLYAIYRELGLSA